MPRVCILSQNTPNSTGAPGWEMQHASLNLWLLICKMGMSIKSTPLLVSESCSVQYSSIPQLCPTLCNPMDWSTPSFFVHHQLLELAQTHVHSSQWCHPTISSSVVPFFSCLQSFLAPESFPMCQFFAPGGQNIGVSVSASALPMNIQDWFPLGLTGWISLLSKGLSRVFSSTTAEMHQFFSTQLSL